MQKQKKSRFIFLMTLGLTFTPSLLAARAPASLTDQERFMQRKVQITSTGQNTLSQTPAAAPLCEYGRRMKRLQDEQNSLSKPATIPTKSGPAARAENLPNGQG